MIYQYFNWWYATGLLWAYQLYRQIFIVVGDSLSVPTLLKTWAAPWKNDVLEAHNVALGDQVKLWEQNAVSRLFGIVMRSIILFVACIILLALLIIGIISLVVWITLPVLIFLLPVLGLWIAQR